VNLRERKKITNKTNTKSQRDEIIIEKINKPNIIKSRRDDIIINRGYDDLSEKKSCFTEDHGVHTENHGEIRSNHFDPCSHSFQLCVLCVLAVKNLCVSQ